MNINKPMTMAELRESAGKAIRFPAPVYRGGKSLFIAEVTGDSVATVPPSARRGTGWAPSPLTHEGAVAARNEAAHWAVSRAAAVLCRSTPILPDKEPNNNNNKKRHTPRFMV